MNWHEEHAGRLTLGERAADMVRNGMGHWGFVGSAVVFLALWIIGVMLWRWPIDNPQLTILNLGLSCLAALQGSILLIAAKRQDQISAALAQHMFEVELQNREGIAEDVAIDKAEAADLAAMKVRMDMVADALAEILLRTPVKKLPKGKSR